MAHLHGERSPWEAASRVRNDGFALFTGLELAPQGRRERTRNQRAATPAGARGLLQVRRRRVRMLFDVTLLHTIHAVIMHPERGDGE